MIKFSHLYGKLANLKSRKSGMVVGFTASSFLKTFSGMVMSLIAIRVIGPEKLGLWQAALIIKPYVGFLQLGLTQGLGRQLPLLMGQERNQKVKDYASSAQFVTIAYTSFFFVISIALSIFFAEGGEESIIYLTAGVFISTMFVDNYLSSTYRSSSSFKDLSKVYTISSIFGLVLVPLIFQFGFTGYLILLLLHSILSTLLLVIFRPIRVGSKFRKSIYLENIKVGFPMLSLNYLRNIPDTYPRILIVFLLSTTALGLTAPANAVLMGFSVLPGAIAKYVFPTMTYEYGKTGSKLQLWNKIKKVSLYLTGFGALGMLSLFVVPYAIENFFPKYEEAVEITMISIGIGFLRMYALIFQVFNTLKSYRAQFKVSITRNVLYLIFPISSYIFAPKGQELNYVFIGILVAELFSTAITFYFVHQVTHTNYNKKEKLKNK